MIFGLLVFRGVMKKCARTLYKNLSTSCRKLFFLAGQNLVQNEWRSYLPICLPMKRTSAGFLCNLEANLGVNMFTGFWYQGKFWNKNEISSGNKNTCLLSISVKTGNFHFTCELLFSNFGHRKKKLSVCGNLVAFSNSLIKTLPSLACGIYTMLHKLVVLSLVP